jgi:hypothetical protein
MERDASSGDKYIHSLTYDRFTEARDNKRHVTTRTLQSGHRSERKQAACYYQDTTVGPQKREKTSGMLLQDGSRSSRRDTSIEKRDKIY